MQFLVCAVTVLVLGNVAILGAHLWIHQTPVADDVASGPLSINNFAVVDDHLWRGAAPTAAGYEELAARGVTTVVDLRAEADIKVDTDRIEALGITRVHLPLRDGQAPGPALVDQFLAVVAGSDSGRVFVHCGAGVGRTGTMAAAYLVETRGVSPREAIRRNLAVGPPSLEQLAFAAVLEPGKVTRPPAAVVGLSRTLDAPRRVWVHLRRSYQ